MRLNGHLSVNAAVGAHFPLHLDLVLPLRLEQAAGRGPLAKGVLEVQ